MPMQMNPNKTWRLVAERLEGETNPRRRHVLELVLDHMKCEPPAHNHGRSSVVSSASWARSSARPESA